MESKAMAEGTVIGGKYVVDRVLGSGGMGAVYAVRHQRLGDAFAMKVLHAEIAKRPEAVERFLREARAALRLDNEHVVRVMDVDVLDDGAPYLVMELLAGVDLQEHLEHSGPLGVEDAVAIMLQACNALADAHALGIVHRDLKPANLFLTRRVGGELAVKVLDFGISKLDAAESLVTATGTLLGTPLYMSPEQMQSARDADGRADQWSLGVILYQALTGQLPFTGQSIPELCLAVLRNEPVEVSALRPGVPREIAAIVARCLAKEPDERFASVAELALALAPHAPAEVRHHAERAARSLGRRSAPGTSGDRLSLAHATTQRALERTSVLEGDARAASAEACLPFDSGDRATPAAPPPMSTVSVASVAGVPRASRRRSSLAALGALLAVILALVVFAWTGGAESGADATLGPAASELDARDEAAAAPSDEESTPDEQSPVEESTVEEPTVEERADDDDADEEPPADEPATAERAETATTTKPAPVAARRPAPRASGPTEKASTKAAPPAKATTPKDTIGF